MIMLFFIIIYSYVTAIIIVLVGVIVFSVIISRAKKGTVAVWIFFLFLILILLFAFGVIDIILDQIAEFYMGTSTYGKMKSIKYALNGQRTLNRTSFHMQSWYAFENNPIIGSMPVGGHSSVLDRLGGLGLLGFIPFTGMFISIIKVENRHYSNKAINYYHLMVCATLVLLYEKGLFGAEGWLFFGVLCPACLTTFDNIE